MRRIYLDYAATTPIDPRVRRRMQPYEGNIFGNPSSLHRFGQEASAAVFAARRTVAEAIGAETAEIIFTASATEANNLALRGVVEAYQKKERGIPRVIVAATEHESVLLPARQLEASGVSVVYLPVSREGVVSRSALEKAIDARTAVISIGYGNGETGTIQPVAEIAKIVRVQREKAGNKNSLYPLFHTDAVQALPYLDCGVTIIGADLVTLSSHKIYGPKGAAALYVRNLPKRQEARIEPLILGGNQEAGFRGGTENVPALVGFGEAVRLVAEQRTGDARKVDELRKFFLSGIQKFWRGARVNGPVPGPKRLPGNLHMHLPGISSDELLVRLDLRGIAASAGAACAARSPEPSHVLRAMGLAKEARESIRFTLGRDTEREEIRTTLRVLKDIYKHA